MCALSLCKCTMPHSNICLKFVHENIDVKAKPDLKMGNLAGRQLTWKRIIDHVAHLQSLLIDALNWSYFATDCLLAGIHPNSILILQKGDMSKRCAWLYMEEIYTQRWECSHVQYANNTSMPIFNALML